MVPALVGSLLIAALSTFGDWIWATFPPNQKSLAGMLHGGLLCLGIGGILGDRRHRQAAGASGGLVIGVLAAGSFYALYRVIGYSAMFVSWVALWLGFGLLYGRWLGRDSLAESLLRGALAAIGSGLAFWAVSGIWRPFDPATKGYLYHFVCWTIAFLPGFAALLVPYGRSAPGTKPASA